MKEEKDTATRIDHNVEIDEVNHEFFVSIDGLPLGTKDGQTKFATVQEAYDASEAAIARNRKHAAND